MFSLPNWLRQKPQKIDKPEDPSTGKPDFGAGPKIGTNIDRPVIDLYRPHITSGDCLIVTGYQDFLSSLAVLMREVKMTKVIEEAELLSRDHQPEISRRVSVVFFSSGAGEH